MTDHIQLWVMPNGEKDTYFVYTPGVFVFSEDKSFCQYPNSDLTLNKLYRKHIFFWRTDRELTNCLKCLAQLRSMENHD